MTNAEDSALIDSLMADLAETPSILIHLSPLYAWAIVANLQLAMRHPNNAGSPARIARCVAESIILNFPPRVAQLARMGFDPKFDI